MSEQLRGPAILERLRVGAEDIRWAVSLVAAEQHTTIDDLWAPHHQLAHLLAVETENFQPRIKRIVAEDRPSLERWDTDAFNQRYEPAGDIVALAEQFAAERANTIALFAVLRSEQWHRTGTWPDGAVVDLAWLAEKALWHSLDHLAQLLDMHGDFEKLQAER
jgi:hypothetical protein